MAWEIKRHDTTPPYVTTLKLNGVVIDLTLAAVVKFKMRPHDAADTTPPTVNANCAITNAVGGQVAYSWAPGDTATVSDYDVEFEITWNDGRVQTIPNGGDGTPYNTVTVVEDLDVG